MESFSIMIAVLLEALKVVLAVKQELAMAAVVVKVSIRITAQKTFREHMGSLPDKSNFKSELEQTVHS